MRLALLGDLVTGGFEYGTNYLVEFDSSSPWLEASLTLADRAMLSGTKCEYHVYQHAPGEILQSLERLGLETEKLIAQERLRIIDTYTPSTRLGSGEDVLHSGSWKGREASNLTTWSENIRKEIQAGIAPQDKRWLHIDDNTSVLFQSFNEEDLVNFYRTALIPWTRARQLLMFWSLVNGVASEALYRKIEALCDGVIDFTSKEEGGEMRHYLRLRNARGKSFDSHWRLLKLQDNGGVTFVPTQRTREFSFKAGGVAKVFGFLVDAFIEDFMTRNINLDRSGWRTLVQISEGAGISAGILYKQYSSSGEIFRELASRGLIETKLFPGERGRGGIVTRFRIAYGKEPVRALVDERVRM